MQTTLAASAATREEKRASQDLGPAATTDSIDVHHHAKDNDPLRATYSDGDFAEQDMQDQKDSQLVVMRDGCGDLMMPFAGFYDEVNFPVTTLFYPPHAPSEMPPHVQLPRRPGPVYKNDLALCGERENSAQTMVSKIWRGIMARRNLRNHRTFEHILNYRARMIQCWWRSVVSRRYHAKLASIKKEWITKRANEYVAEKQKGLLNMMTWQRCRFEGSAIKLQRIVRWHLNWRARQRCQEQGLPEDQWPEELPFPLAHKFIRYFPWRSCSAKAAPVAAPTGAAGSDGDESSSDKAHRRTILEFKKERDPVEPPSQEEVEKENQLMRRKNQARSVTLSQPEVLSRKEWKQEGLRQEDLDFNAGVIQRLYRAQKSDTKVRTVELTKAYMDKTVRTISRTFAMYILIQHMKVHRAGIARQVRERLNKYSKGKIDEINLKLVWGKDLLEACARSIQQCWHWYRFERFGILPLRIQKELDRRENLAREKEELAERRRLEREEAIRKLKESLGATDDAAVPAAEEAPAEPAEEQPEEAAEQQQQEAAEQQEQPEEVAEQEQEQEQDQEQAEEPEKEQEQEQGEEQPQEQEQEQEEQPQQPEQQPQQPEQEEDSEQLEEERRRRAEDERFAELDQPYEYEEPVAPPYHLIDDYLAREEELRDALMNQLERNKLEMVNNHKYVTYTPEKVNVRKNLNVFIPKTA